MGTPDLFPQDRDRLERGAAPDRSTASARHGVWRDAACVTKHCWGDPVWRGAEGLADGVGFLRDLDLFGVYAALPPIAEATLNAYRGTIPEARWGRIADFVRDAVSVAAPACAYSTRQLMIVVSGYVDWTVNVAGYPMQANIVFRGELIKRYVERPDATWAKTTRRTYRALLLRVMEILIPDAPAVDFAPMHDRVSNNPYTEPELRDLVRWANGQGSEERRRNAAVLLGLCCGAGLWAHEISEVRRGDLDFDADGIVVHVPGKNARAVPVLARWESMLRDAVADLPDEQFVFGQVGRSGDPKNLVTNFTGRSDHAGIARPQTNRMRATWLVTHLAAGTDVRALMQASGMAKFENLVRLIQHIPALDTPDYRRMLRRAAAPPP